MICKKVSAVLINSTTPLVNGFKRAKLSAKKQKADYTSIYQLQAPLQIPSHLHFLQVFINRKRRRWLAQSNYRLCDLPASLCAEEG